MKKTPLKSLFQARPWMWNLILAVMLLVGFAVRLYDLTDPPLDFAPTRQLFSALKARGMYYRYVTDAPEWQRQAAIALGDVGNIEPPVMETIVSQTYRLTGEHVWIGRIYSSLFWVLGGLALFLLIRAIASNGAAAIGTLFYLFTPYGIISSRAFQPDPLMVALVIYALWALFHWQNTPTWKWAVLFGIFSGLALFVKNVSVFLIAGAFAGSILGTCGLKRAIRDPQVWSMGVLLILPTIIYTLTASVGGTLLGQLSFHFFPKMWIDPAFYFRWAFTVGNIAGFGATLLAGLSIFLADPRRERPLLAGLWIGYFVYGIVFSYAFFTHDYYQMPFIPVVAISMAPALYLFLQNFFKRSPGILPRLILTGAVLFGTAVQAWTARAILVSSDYRNEAVSWAKIGDALGHTSGVVGLTQDYGYRLAYWGWQGSASWFTSADLGLRYMAGQDVDVLKKFQEDTAGKKYFIVTMFNEFDRQPEVKDLLYTHYPVYAETYEYVIFDLQHPLEDQP